MTCPECGVPLTIGDFPFCPHGTARLGAIGDDIPGGQVIETLGHEPITFYSKQAILAEADKRGLRLRDQWAGPGDQYLSNWAGVTSKTLDDARVLLSRGANRTEEEVRCETATFSVSDGYFAFTKKGDA